MRRGVACRSRIRVQGSGFRVQGSGFRVWGLGVRVQPSGFEGLGPALRAFRLKGLAFSLVVVGAFGLWGSRVVWVIWGFRV